MTPREPRSPKVRAIEDSAQVHVTRAVLRSTTPQEVSIEGFHRPGRAVNNVPKNQLGAE